MSDSDATARARGRVNRERAAALTLELVRIPSPTGDTVDVSRRLAEELEAAGAEVSIFDQFPRTPVVIGRFRGAVAGKTLILNGHLDTVPIPHAPAERRDGRIYGRGSADMKGAVVAALEAARALREAEVPLAGDIVVAAHGLHEAPGGRGEDLAAALTEGALTGDAAIVCEAGAKALPLFQLGMGIFTATFRREGEVIHEQRAAPGTPHPLVAVGEAAVAVSELNARLAKNPLEYCGPETCFVGQIHGGDFYNRFATEGMIEGTRRWSPQKSCPEVAEELEEIFRGVAKRRGVSVEFELSVVRDSYEIPQEHPLVECLQQAHEAVTGARLPLTGNRLVADASIFARDGGIPCLYHGLAGEGAHADVESLPESELERAAQVYALTAASYLGVVA